MRSSVGSKKFDYWIRVMFGVQVLGVLTGTIVPFMVRVLFYKGALPLHARMVTETSRGQINSGAKLDSNGHVSMTKDSSAAQLCRVIGIACGRRASQVGLRVNTSLQPHPESVRGSGLNFSCS